ncbi:MAG: prepilin-type N-terminal cleavage/methylation domain-containing protein [Candidatus Omnitrophota bacterium]|nr:prepilin-type N-terminal cleavage/methylation domain-containing protein [Candidatus Omnitrophota bacterium]
MTTLTKRHGFTLIEVAMATTILLVGIVGIASLIPVALNANMRAKNISTAAVLAETWIEEKKRDVSISGSNWNNIISQAETSFSSPYDNFKWSTAVTEASGLKQITLTITWEERWRTQAAARTEIFEAFIAKR